MYETPSKNVPAGMANMEIVVEVEPEEVTVNDIALDVLAS
jgi:hypothetical protein